VKKRFVARMVLALAAALPMGACDSESTVTTPTTPNYGSNYGFCSSFRSCDTCTPQNGCGWCYNSDGTGQCASDPSECATPSFEWTWNPDGCRVPAQATTPGRDAAAEETDAGSFAKGDAASSDDVAASACLGPGANAPPDAGDGGEGGQTGCVVEVP
jgi:hypothetical protein